MELNASKIRFDKTGQFLAITLSVANKEPDGSFNCQHLCRQQGEVINGELTITSNDHIAVWDFKLRANM